MKRSQERGICDHALRECMCVCMQFGGFSALHLAVSHGHLECVKLLLEQEGVNVNIKDSFGNTPLELAEDAHSHALNALKKAEESNDEAKIEEQREKQRATDVIIRLLRRKMAKSLKHPLPKLPRNKSFHVYISHVFSSNHEAASRLKNLLEFRGLLCSMNTEYLLDLASEQEHVHESLMGLILLDSEYMSILATDSSAAQSRIFAYLTDYLGPESLVFVSLDAASKDQTKWKGPLSVFSSQRCFALDRKNDLSGNGSAIVEEVFDAISGKL